MTQWSQAEHTAIRSLVHSDTILRAALERFCEETARRARKESGEFLLSLPRNVDGAVNHAVKADDYEKFFQRLKAELSSFERAAAALASSAEPTREEE